MVQCKAFDLFVNGTTAKTPCSVSADFPNFLEIRRGLDSMRS